MPAKLNLRTIVRLLAATIAVLAVAAPIATAHSVNAAKHRPLGPCGKKGSKHRCACPRGSKLKHSGGRFRCVKAHQPAPQQTDTPTSGSSPTTTTTPPTTANGPAPTSVPFPLGAYTCWHTIPSTDPLMPPNTFGSAVVATVTFAGDGTYHKANDIVGGNWHEAGNTIVFTSGLLFQTGNFDQGEIFPSGTTMPHAAAPATPGGYTLVIKDTQQEGGDPPSQEFSSTDGPNNSFSTPVSFWYCKM